MKIGLLVTIYNRPEYVQQCLDSLSNVFTKQDVTLLLYDDFSNNAQIRQLINCYSHPVFKVEKHFASRNGGISRALLFGLTILKQKGCEVFINLDSDSIVKPNLIDVLFDLKLRFRNKIVSGFNTITQDPKSGTVRHQCINEFKDHYTKKSIGGINMCFDRFQLDTVIMRAIKSPGHWDWNVCKYQKEFIVSKPSIVQHIGIDKGIHLNTPDIAFDYE